jgi:D-aminopeptidase
MRARIRDLGITIGTLPTGPLNAITDLHGVSVGHETVCFDDPVTVRTGITAIKPHPYEYWDKCTFAGVHRFNGFGELMGMQWIEESGVLSSPIMLTSTASIGVVRDTILAHPGRHGITERFHQPVVGETNDSLLSETYSGAIKAENVMNALASTRTGSVEEGSVGGGTGMVCFEFKGGIGTSSRISDTRSGTFCVGVLVQANFGTRQNLTIAGAPVGRLIGYHQVESPRRRGDGSIIIIVATDAPLIPSQCRRLAQRAIVGLGRSGGYGADTSGDLILAFSTANIFPAMPDGVVEHLRMIPNRHISPLFQAVAEATEEAIMNSMTAADSMIGRNGTTVHAIPLESLREIFADRASNVSS